MRKNEHKSMEEAISLRLFFIGLFSLLIGIFVCGVLFFTAFDRQIESELRDQASLFRSLYSSMGPGSMVGAQEESIRITLIQKDGVVLWDNRTEASAMENHRDRPEVKETLQYGEGHVVRNSETISANVYYYALRLEDGNVIRVAKESASLYAFFSSALLWILLLVIALLVVAAVASLALTKKLLAPIATLVHHLSDQKGNTDPVYKEFAPFMDEINGRNQQIAMHLEALTEEKNRLAAIMEHMAEGMLIVDRDRHLLMANDAAQTLLEFQNNPEGENIFVLTKQEEILECVDSGVRGKGKTKLAKIGGRDVQVMGSPVEQDGEIMGALCMLMDVTEREEMQRMRQEFTANVSHELKTPLTSISGYGEMIETGMAKEQDIRRFAGRIREEAARLLLLIGDIIQLSRLEEGESEKAWEKVNLQSVALSCKDRLEMAAAKKDVSIDVVGDAMWVDGDEAMLTELIYNLCDNAIRYNVQGGRVVVTLRGMSVTVSDTGIGIPEEHLPHICKRFYRVDKSRSRETGGTGLGLAIVKYICRIHGGIMDVESKVGKGTSITVKFPSVS